MLHWHPVTFVVVALVVVPTLIEIFCIVNKIEFSCLPFVNLVIVVAIGAIVFVLK